MRRLLLKIKVLHPSSHLVAEEPLTPKNTSHLFGLQIKLVIRWFRPISHDKFHDLRSASSSSSSYCVLQSNPWENGKEGNEFCKRNQYHLKDDIKLYKDRWDFPNKKHFVHLHSPRLNIEIPKNSKNSASSQSNKIIPIRNNRYKSTDRRRWKDDCSYLPNSHAHNPIIQACISSIF
jgi:hypothetical protein